MLTYDTHPRIVIDLSPGLYVFRFESGSGKTYLHNKLALRTAAGEPVLTYTYNDYLRGFSLLQMVQSRPFDLLMVVRFDMFKNSKEAREAIMLAAKKAIVLVSAKTANLRIGQFRPVRISLTPDCIKVGI